MDLKSASIKALRLFLAIGLILTSSCSHLFYQPSRKLFATPQAFRLEYRDIFFESLDGTPLHAWHLPHRQSFKTSRGLVVQFHGNAENISSFFASMAWVTHYGFDLFIFDYRGYGRSSGNPSQKGVFYDGIAALIKANQIHDELGLQKSMVVYGQSLGGNIGLKSLSHLNDKSRIQTIVIDSSFLNYKNLARQKLASFFLTWPLQWLASILISNDFAPNALEIKSLAPIPLLVVHGTDDPIIPIEHGREIFEFASEPKYFWEVKNGGHIDAMVYHGGIYREKLIQFILNSDSPR